MIMERDRRATDRDVLTSSLDLLTFIVKTRLDRFNRHSTLDPTSMQYQTKSNDDAPQDPVWGQRLNMSVTATGSYSKNSSTRRCKRSSSSIALFVTSSKVSHIC